MIILDVNSINPMKPKTLLEEDYKKLLKDFNYAAEYKYDGERYICKIVNNKMQYTSLHKSAITNKYVDKTDRLPHINKTDKNINGTILDGEIYAKTLEGTVSIMGSLPSEAIKKQKEKGFVRYRVFDCLVYKGKDIRKETYLTRRRYAKMAIEELNNKYIKLSLAVIKNKQQFLDNVLNSGGEGVVLKNIKSSYAESRKHKFMWVKIKSSIKVDVVIMGYEMGKGKYNKDKIGAIIYGAYKDGKLEKWGKVGGMTKKIIEEITNNQNKYIGHVIEIEGQSFTKAGNLRHSRFKRLRVDKAKKDCIKTSKQS